MEVRRPTNTNIEQMRTRMTGFNELQRFNFCDSVRDLRAVQRFAVAK